MHSSDGLRAQDIDIFQPKYSVDCLPHRLVNGFTKLVNQKVKCRHGLHIVLRKKLGIDVLCSQTIYQSVSHIPGKGRGSFHCNLKVSKPSCSLFC